MVLGGQMLLERVHAVALGIDHRVRAALARCEPHGPAAPEEELAEGAAVRHSESE